MRCLYNCSEGVSQPVAASTECHGGVGLTQKGRVCQSSPSSPHCMQGRGSSKFWTLFGIFKSKTVLLGASQEPEFGAAPYV